MKNTSNTKAPSRQCSIEGCDNKHTALDFCKKHYVRFKKHGCPHVVKERPKNRGADNPSYKHGLAGNRMYNIWVDMKRRCDNSNRMEYEYYGGRGIKYDPRWAEFEAFFMDMADTYTDSGTIERVDVDGNYCKENCTWIPLSEQPKNRRPFGDWRFGFSTKAC